MLSFSGLLQELIQELFNTVLLSSILTAPDKVVETLSGTWAGSDQMAFSPIRLKSIISERAFQDKGGITMLSQPNSSNQTSIALIPGIVYFQKSFVKDLRSWLASIVEEISGAEEDEDEKEINFQLFSLFVPFDGGYKEFHETVRNFTEINRGNLLQAAQVSLSYSTFLGNVLMKTSQILDGALKSKDYSNVINEFDNQIVGLLN